MKRVILLISVWILVISLYIFNIIMVIIHGANIASNISGWVCAIILGCFLSIPAIIQIYKTEKREKEYLKKLDEEFENSIKYSESTRFNVNQDVWVIKGTKNKRVAKGKIYGIVNDSTYRIKVHNNHLTRYVKYIFKTKEEALEKLEANK